MEGKGHRFTADLVQVGRSPVTAKERAEWLRLDALARSRKYGPVAESADDLDALAALIAEAELAEAVGPVVPGRWITLKDGRHVYIKDKGAGTGPMGPGTAQSTLGAEPAPTPVAPTAPTAEPVGNTIATVAHWEESVRGADVEHVSIYDRNGYRVYQGVGTKTSCDIPPDVCRAAAGGTLTHNHPSGKSFSGQDVKLALKFNMASIRAVGSNGTYVMDLIGFPSERPTLGNIDYIYGNTLDAEADKMMARVYGPEKLDPREADILAYHATWEQIAEQWPRGLKYRREDRT